MASPCWIGGRAPDADSDAPGTVSVQRAASETTVHGANPNHFHGVAGA